jgi:hypothetical protein
MECPECGSLMDEIDYTTSNIPSSKWYGHNTGIIYQCTNEECEARYIDNKITGDFEVWHY